MSRPSRRRTQMPARTGLSILVLSVAMYVLTSPGALAPIPLEGTARGGEVGQASAQVQDAGALPNLLFILTDDQRADTMVVMPKTRAEFPVRFSKAFVTTPVCCPARASYLTGRYARHTGVHANGHYERFRPSEPDSLGPWLQARGYYTGFVGKYLNRFGQQHGVPPGWNEFYARVGDTSEASPYTELTLREYWGSGPDATDQVRSYPNDDYPSVYATSLFGDLAVRFLDRAHSPSLYNPDGKPWALFVWPNAPHVPLQPESVHADAAVPPFQRPPSFLERRLGDKPPEVRSVQSHLKARRHRQIRAGQLRMLRSVDDQVERVFDAIEANGWKDSTWGIYASDNGYFWGEHRLSGKRLAFEESARVPFRVSGPGLDDRTIRATVANIDVAPTLLALAQDPTARPMDGRSLLPLLDGTATGIRSGLIIEAWRPTKGFQALRTDRWKYIRWRGSGNEELYDLHKDPFELRNKAARRQGVADRLLRRMRKMIRA